jgi:PKD repeat protein
LRFVTDDSISGTGFNLTWQCKNKPLNPYVDFSSPDTNTCSGYVNFHDFTTNSPEAWLWIFGDGSFSTEQNPSHQYTENGNYTVVLISANQFGFDTLTKGNYIKVNKSGFPVVQNFNMCDSGSAMLKVLSLNSDEYLWYYDQNGGIPFYSGSTYYTPVLHGTTNYYVEGVNYGNAKYIAINDSSGGGTYDNSSITNGVVFNSNNPFKLKSVKVYAQNAGYRTIRLTDSTGVVLQSTDVYINQGESRIPIDFNIPFEEKLHLECVGNSGLYYNTSLSVVGHNFDDINLLPSGNNNYNYFYSWEIKPVTCITNRSTATASVATCSGVGEMVASENILVYPNPANSSVNIKIPSEIGGDYNIKLSDMSGRIVINESIKTNNNSGVNRIDISKLLSGLYIIEITNNTNRLIQKLEVQ